MAPLLPKFFTSFINIYYSRKDWNCYRAARVKRSVTYVSTAVQNPEFSLWKPIKGNKFTKSVLENLEYGFPEFWFLLNQAGLRIEGSNVEHLL